MIQFTFLNPGEPTEIELIGPMRRQQIKYPRDSLPTELMPAFGELKVAETLTQLRDLAHMLPDIRAGERKGFDKFTSNSQELAKKWTNPYSTTSIIETVRKTKNAMTQQFNLGISNLLPPGRTNLTKQWCLKETRDEQVLVIGDLHGCFHSLVRMLSKWNTLGYITDNLILNDGWMIVFTGDLVDRCFLSLETVLIVCMLFNKNPKTVRVCSGNHESSTNLWTRYGFWAEICNDFGQTNQDKILMFQLVSTFMSVYFIRENKTAQWVQFSHGVFDVGGTDHTVETLKWLHTSDSEKRLFNNIEKNGYQWTDVTSSSVYGVDPGQHRAFYNAETIDADNWEVKMTAGINGIKGHIKSVKPDQSRPMLDYVMMKFYMTVGNIGHIFRGHQDNVNLTLIPASQHVQMPVGVFEVNDVAVVYKTRSPTELDPGITLPLLYEIAAAATANDVTWTGVVDRINEFCFDHQTDPNNNSIGTMGHILGVASTRWSELKMIRDPPDEIKINVSGDTMSFTTKKDGGESTTVFNNLHCFPVFTISSSLSCRPACNYDAYAVLSPRPSASASASSAQSAHSLASSVPPLSSLRKSGGSGGKRGGSGGRRGGSGGKRGGGPSEQTAQTKPKPKRRRVVEERSRVVEKRPRVVAERPSKRQKKRNLHVSMVQMMLKLRF